MCVCICVPVRVAAAIGLLLRPVLGRMRRGQMKRSVYVKKQSIEIYLLVNKYIYIYRYVRVCVYICVPVHVAAAICWLLRPVVRRIRRGQIKTCLR